MPVAPKPTLTSCVCCELLDRRADEPKHCPPQVGAGTPCRVEAGRYVLRARRSAGEWPCGRCHRAAAKPWQSPGRAEQLQSFLDAEADARAAIGPGDDDGVKSGVERDRRACAASGSTVVSGRRTCATVGIGDEADAIDLAVGAAVFEKIGEKVDRVYGSLQLGAAGRIRLGHAAGGVDDQDHTSTDLESCHARTTSSSALCKRQNMGSRGEQRWVRRHPG